MWTKPKDSAQSWEQRSWQFALESYERLKGTLESAKRTQNETLRKYCEKGIAELEARYPKLKQ